MAERGIRPRESMYRISRPRMTSLAQSAHSLICRSIPLGSGSFPYTNKAISSRDGCSDIALPSSLEYFVKALTRSAYGCSGGPRRWYLERAGDLLDGMSLQ